MAPKPPTPLRDIIRKSLKQTVKGTASAAETAAPRLTKAERKAANQAKAAADRAAKTGVSRAKRADRKIINKKKFNDIADEAVDVLYGQGDTRLMKAKQGAGTIPDRALRQIERADSILAKGVDNPVIDKEIAWAKDFLAKNGYTFTESDAKAIANQYIDAAQRMKASAEATLKTTVGRSKAREEGPLKALGSKTIRSGSSRKPASQQTPLQREAARSVRNAKKAGREANIAEGARQAARRERKGEKLVDVVSDTRRSGQKATQADIDKALRVSRDKKLSAQARKKRLAEMQERAPSKRGMTEKAKEEAKRSRATKAKLESQDAERIATAKAPRGQEKALAELEKSYGRGLITKEKYLINRRRIINTRPRLTSAEKEASLTRLARDKGSAMKRNKPVQRYGNPATRVRAKKK